MTEFRVEPHSVISGRVAVEIWTDGFFVGMVYPADGCGVRVVSKFEKSFHVVEHMTTEVRIHPPNLEPKP